MSRSTHTYVLLEVSIPTWEEIRDKLLIAGYDHVFGEHDGKPIADMTGIAVVGTMKPYGVDGLASSLPRPEGGGQGKPGC